jgi:hypothetical protein
MTAAEITQSSPVPIMNQAGRPVNFGWARTPLFEYNPPSTGGAAPTRISESDRYIIFSATHMIVFEVVDGGFLGHVGVSVISIKDHHRSTHGVEVLLSMGRFDMPRLSEEGAVKIREKNAALDFVVMKNGSRIIRIDFPRFGHHRYLRGEVVLSSPFAAPQSIAAVSSWRRDKSAFRYFRCSPWFIAEGVMQFGTAEMYFTRDNAWGIYDWKREVRPRKDLRYWAAACGTSGGRLVGFSVSYGLASAGAENAFFVEGVIHKLDQVTFHIPPSGWIEEWRFTSGDGRLDMTFNPSQERMERRSFLFHSVKCRQICGTFSGRVILDDGSPLAFWHITGFAERRKTRF